MQRETDGSEPSSVQLFKSQLIHTNKRMPHCAYSHQSFPKHRGCNISPRRRWWLPGSINSRCGLLCISVCSRSTWLASGKGKRNREDIS